MPNKLSTLSSPTKLFCFTIHGEIYYKKKLMSASKIYKLRDKNNKNDKGSEGEYLNQIIELMDDELSNYFKNEFYIKDFEFLLKPGNIENPLLYVYVEKRKLSSYVNHLENLEHEVTTEGTLSKTYKTFHINWGTWSSC